MDDDDNDFGGGGDDWDGPREEPPGQDQGAPEGIFSGTVEGDPSGGGMQTRGGHGGDPGGGNGEEEEVDPWKPLDPHDPGMAVVRPYKRGGCPLAMEAACADSG
jgi:hypothetical protein